MIAVNTMNRHWFVVYTNPKNEFLAEAQLRRQKHDVLLPTYVRQFKRLGDRKVPLLGRYLFVRFDPDNDNWRPILSTYGVRRLFMTTDMRPIAVPDNDIDRLVEYTGARPTEPGMVVDIVRRQISIGQDVRIIDGAWADHLGTVASIDDKTWRAKVILLLFGRRCEVQFDLDNLVEDYTAERAPQAA